MNLAIDLEGLRRVWGGPVSGEIATDVLPDTLTEGRLTTADYTPHQQGDMGGDLEAARAEMARSRYDRDRDGRCDAAACRDVLTVSTNVSPYTRMTPIVRAGAAGIGVDLEVREPAVDAAIALAATPARGAAHTTIFGWSKDLPDPSSFMNLFSSRGILPEGNVNISLVGLTERQARELGVELPPGGVPSVDADIDACAPLSGEDRTSCYVALDRRITEEVIPWVPYLDANNLNVLGPAVTAYDFDQLAGSIALGHVAVDPERQRS
jgi:hypothetical protein